jgi:dCTP deaminase
MSILLKSEIEHKVKEKRIHIYPYTPSQIGPNSYDVRLSPVLKVYDFHAMRSVRECLDCASENPTKTFEIPLEGYVLQPGVLYLGSTVEEAGSDYYIPMYEGRSSMARLGIQSHVSAGFGDIGFKSNWTLEIIVVHPVRVYPNMRIGQIYFHHVSSEVAEGAQKYHGKYATQTSPQESKSYLDFETENVGISLS